MNRVIIENFLVRNIINRARKTIKKSINLNLNFDTKINLTFLEILNRNVEYNRDFSRNINDEISFNNKKNKRQKLKKNKKSQKLKEK